MEARTTLLLTALVVIATTASAAKRPHPPAPVSWEVANRAVVATAKLIPTNKTLSNAKGSATMLIPRPDKNNTIVVVVTLGGGLTDITMAHIHVKNASANNPIAIFLQPRLNFTARPARLDPPVSYKGTYSFVSTYNSDNITAVTPGWSLETLLDMLSNGLLYVNVHTSSQPGGALQGTLGCESDICIWPVCSAVPGGPPC